MCLKIYLVIAATVCIQSVFPTTVTISLETNTNDFECGLKAVFKCQSDDTDCCSTFGKTRFWRKNGEIIMNHGVETKTSNKYTETFDDNLDRFYLTVQDLTDADFDQTYGCEYVSNPDSFMLERNKNICKLAPECGGICFAFSLIGSVMVLLIQIVGYFCLKSLRKRWTLPFVTVMMWIPSIVLSFLVTFLTCTFKVLNCKDEYQLTTPWIVCGLIFSMVYAVFSCLYFSKPDKSKSWSRIICCIATAGIVICAELYDNWKKNFKRIRAKVGSDVHLECPHKEDAIGQINWIKINGTRRITYSEGTSYNLEDLPKQLIDRLTVKGRDLFISNVQESDTGIYACELIDGAAAPQVAKLELTVLGGENSQSVESGSSCWPICRVGQDPNTSSSDPEKVRRSPEKERADKKKERKPTEVVRPQPSRPLPPLTQHLKTDNTGREDYSTENEMFKPRPLPNISGHSDSPRPLPKRTPDGQLEKGGIQLEPLVDSTSDRKKKKKRKKKETKQSDEDD